MLSLYARTIRLTPLLLMLLLMLCSCSGTGGSSSSNSQLNTGLSTTTSGTLTIAASVLQLSQTTTVSANFKKSDGTPASSIPVTFVTTLGSLTPAGGAATTDASGTATVQLVSGTSSGQGQVSASATVDGKVVNLSQAFTVTLPALKLANLTLTNNNTGAIDFGSSQGISVDVQNADGTPFTSQSVSVVFTSTQVTQGNATISSPVASVNGTASTTYTAVTASGPDLITATIASSGSNAGSSLSVALTVNPLLAGSISFVSAVPPTIGLKGMGGLGIQEASRVTFKVVDTSGAVKPNQAVNFALNTTVGGLSLSTLSGSTGADGTVSTIVQAGVVATPVRVTATTTVGNIVLSTQSDQLVVSTGVPAQDGFSVSRVNQNPEAWDIDGVTTAVTARLSDHFHNPVPDGTAVYFTTSGGSIEPSCLTVKGACSVNWTSQNPRPLGPGQISPLVTTGALKNGRAVVLAYAIGEEAFVDLNGNGVADPGEFTDTSEAFRDDNEDGVRQASETFIDFNGDGVFNGPDGKYNGVLQGTAFTGAPKSKHVFSNSVIVMSSSAALISSAPAVIAGPGAFSITVTDINGNTMPSGTKIVVVVPFGTLTGLAAYTVPLNAGFGVTLPLFISGSSTPTAQTGGITVTVTSPAGLVTTKLITISGSF